MAGCEAGAGTAWTTTEALVPASAYSPSGRSQRYSVSSVTVAVVRDQPSGPTSVGPETVRHSPWPGARAWSTSGSPVTRPAASVTWPLRTTSSPAGTCGAEAAIAVSRVIPSKSHVWPAPRTASMLKAWPSHPKPVTT